MVFALSVGGGPSGHKREPLGQGARSSCFHTDMLLYPKSLVPPQMPRAHKNMMRFLKTRISEFTDRSHNTQLTLSSSAFGGVWAFREVAELEGLYDRAARRGFDVTLLKVPWSLEWDFILLFS